jgi:hypothetical protein
MHLILQEEVFKVKKITHPGSGKNSSRIPDPEGKKHRIPDLGSRMSNTAGSS